MAMSQAHKASLTRNRLRLIREVILSQELYAILQSNYTLTQTMVEEIESVKTTQGKIGKLLDILPRRGSGAFPTFIDALYETHQGQLVELLDPSYVPSSSSSGSTPLFVSQPRDSGPGGDQLAPSATSSSIDQPSTTKSERDIGRQLQQPSDALSDKPPSSKRQAQQPSHENAASKNISGWSVEDDITQCILNSSNESFIFNLYTPDDGKEPGKMGSLRDGRCIIFRNETTKKPGYLKLFDDVNLNEAFKKFGIKVESTHENKSPEEIIECLCKEVDTVTSAFFLFVFASGSGDVILTENGSCIFTHDIVNIVKKSAALKGKPKVLIFHLSDPGSGDYLDSVAEPPSLESLSLSPADDNLAILKVTSGDMQIHWLVSSLIFLMTKHSKNLDLSQILEFVKSILLRQNYSVTLNNSLKSGLYFTS